MHCTVNLHFNQLRRSFAVTGNRHSQTFADMCECSGKSLPVRMQPRQLFIPGQPARHRHQHVIGACIPIYRNHIKSGVGRGTQQTEQIPAVNHSIRGHEAQHRSHIRMNHSRAFSSSGNGNFHFTGLYFDAAFFFDQICR
ncbi:hypothetical protein D3C74_388380 [compost metagenome]